MSRIKTMILLTAVMLASPVQASEALRKSFAHCAGRLSADMEHRWLTEQPVEEAELRRNAMVALLTSLPPAPEPRQVLAMRIAAKVAHRGLLHRATFNDDPQDAAWARARAETELARCASLVLM